jgi:hypothetical protein
MPMGVERFAVARMDGGHPASFRIALLSEEDWQVGCLKISKGDVVGCSSPKIVVHERNPTRPAEKCQRFASRGDRIRTCGLLVPNQALYQAELRPGKKLIEISGR